MQEELKKQIQDGTLQDFMAASQNALTQKFDFNSVIAGSWTCLHFSAYLGKSTHINWLINHWYNYLIINQIVTLMQVK